MTSLYFLIFVLSFISMGYTEGDAEIETADLMDEPQQAVEALAKQESELITAFRAMKDELRNEIRDMISEAKLEFTALNNDTRTDISTLQHLLDTDECADLSHNCSSDATCRDTRVSFRCKCKKGFTGDGHTCADIDECSELNRCAINARCRNYPGGYGCDCNKGYKGDGEKCEDIDECSDGSNRCHKYAVCENTPGAYTCKCSLYHEGDGFTCKEVPMEGCEAPFKAVKGVGCLHIIEKSQNFEQSRESCKKLGGDLFVAINPDHYLRLAQYFIDTNQKDVKKYMYVGVKEGVWLNGRKVDSKEEAPRNPSMGSGTCSYTDGDTDEKFLLWTDPCRDTWWALCERKTITNY